MGGWFQGLTGGMRQLGEDAQQQHLMDMQMEHENRRRMAEHLLTIMENPQKYLPEAINAAAQRHKLITQTPLSKRLPKDAYDMHSILNVQVQGRNYDQRPGAAARMQMPGVGTSQPQQGKDMSQPPAGSEAPGAQGLPTPQFPRDASDTPAQLTPEQMPAPMIDETGNLAQGYIPGATPEAMMPAGAQQQFKTPDVDQISLPPTGSAMYRGGPDTWTRPGYYTPDELSDQAFSVYARQLDLQNQNRIRQIQEQNKGKTSRTYEAGFRLPINGADASDEGWTEDVAGNEVQRDPEQWYVKLRNMQTGEIELHHDSVRSPRARVGTPEYWYPANSPMDPNTNLPTQVYSLYRTTDNQGNIVYKNQGNQVIPADAMLKMSKLDSRFIQNYSDSTTLTGTDPVFGVGKQLVSTKRGIQSAMPPTSGGPGVAPAATPGTTAVPTPAERPSGVRDVRSSAAAAAGGTYKKPQPTAAAPTPPVPGGPTTPVLPAPRPGAATGSGNATLDRLSIGVGRYEGPQTPEALAAMRRNIEEMSPDIQRVADDAKAAGVDKNIMADIDKQMADNDAAIKAGVKTGWDTKELGLQLFRAAMGYDTIEGFKPSEMPKNAKKLAEIGKRWGTSYQMLAAEWLDNPRAIETSPSLRDAKQGSEVEKAMLAVGLPTAGKLSPTTADKMAFAYVTLEAAQQMEQLIMRNYDVLLGPLQGRYTKLRSLWGSISSNSATAAIAQEFLARAEYFLAMEAKVLMGARPAYSWAARLANVTANPRMNIGEIIGALAAAKAHAQNQIKEAYVERYGANWMEAFPGFGNPVMTGAPHLNDMRYDPVSDSIQVAMSDERGGLVWGIPQEGAQLIQEPDGSYRFTGNAEQAEEIFSPHNPNYKYPGWVTKEYKGPKVDFESWAGKASNVYAKKNGRYKYTF